MVSDLVSVPSIPCTQSAAAASDRGVVAAPGHDGSGGRERSSAGNQGLAATTAGHGPLSIEINGQYAAINEVLLRHCEQDHPQPQDSAAPRADGHPCLLRFLTKIPGCGWLRGQFDSDTQTAATRPSQPTRQPVRPQNGQCAACQSDWPPADRFCADLASQAHEMQLDWYEVEALVDAFARRIAASHRYKINKGRVGRKLTLPASAQKASSAEPHESANGTDEEQEILSYQGFTTFNRRFHVSPDPLLPFQAAAVGGCTGSHPGSFSGALAAKKRVNAAPSYVSFRDCPAALLCLPAQTADRRFES